MVSFPCWEWLSVILPGKAVSTLVISPVSAISRTESRSSRLQRPLLNDVDQSHGEDQNEHQHLDKTEEPQPPKHHGPGVEEDNFHIEDDEQNRDQIELYREAPPGRSARGIATLERLVLDRRVLFRTEEGASKDHCPCHYSPQDQRYQDRDVLLHEKRSRIL